MVLEVNSAGAVRDIAAGWVWLAAGGLAFLAAAVVAARMLTRWVLRPITGLERAVAEMTERRCGAFLGGRCDGNQTR